MKIRPSDRRLVATVEEWPVYQYRCPDCGQWSDGSDVTQRHDDGTDSVLCETCAAKIDFDGFEPPVAAAVK